MGRLRQIHKKYHTRYQTNHTNWPHRYMPSKVLTQEPWNNPSKNGADCVSADIQPHRRPKASRFNFFSKISHRNRRETSERNPLNGSQYGGVWKFGLKADARQRTDAASMDTAIIGLRPHTSDNEPKTSMLTAKSIVVTDKERLAVVGVTWNSRVNSSMSGCTQYRMANVLKPAAKKANVILRKTGVPFWMYVIGTLSAPHHFVEYCTP